MALKTKIIVLLVLLVLSKSSFAQQVAGSLNDLFPVLKASAIGPAILDINTSSTSDSVYQLSITLSNPSDVDVDYYTVADGTGSNRLFAFSIELSNVVTHVVTNTIDPNIRTFTSTDEFEGTLPDGTEIHGYRGKKADGSISAKSSATLRGDVSDLVRDVASTGEYEVIVNVWLWEGLSYFCSALSAEGCGYAMTDYHLPSLL